MVKACGYLRPFIIIASIGSHSPGNYKIWPAATSECFIGGLGHRKLINGRNPCEQTHNNKPLPKVAHEYGQDS